MNLFKDKNNRQKKIAIQNDKPIFQSQQGINVLKKVECTRRMKSY